MDIIVFQKKTDNYWDLQIIFWLDSSHPYCGQTRMMIMFSYLYMLLVFVEENQLRLTWHLVNDRMITIQSYMIHIWSQGQKLHLLLFLSQFLKESKGKPYMFVNGYCNISLFSLALLFLPFPIYSWVPNRTYYIDVAWYSVIFHCFV